MLKSEARSWKIDVDYSESSLEIVLAGNWLRTITSGQTVRDGPFLFELVATISLWNLLFVSPMDEQICHLLCPSCLTQNWENVTILRAKNSRVTRAQEVDRTSTKI